MQNQQKKYKKTKKVQYVKQKMTKLSYGIDIIAIPIELC